MKNSVGLNGAKKRNTHLIAINIVRTSQAGNAVKFNFRKTITMIQITDDIYIPDSELQFDFIRGSGPGGQNVNKVASAVQLRFDAEASNSIPEDMKSRLNRLAGKRMTEKGELIIHAKKYRQQEQNRKDAVDRFVRLLQAAARPPRPRRRTKPSRAAKERRIQNKRQTAQKKQLRRDVPSQDE